MLFRRAVLESRSVLADSGENVTPITVRDPITGLWVEVRVTNGTTGNQSNLVAQNVTAIELVDGSQVLFSMNGEEALAWTAYYLNKMPNQLVDEIASNVQNMSVFIPFGRWIGDTEYALDPSRFQNLQLRIRWNLATVTAVGATGFGTGTARLTVVAETMEGAPTPHSMLMAKQHWSGAGASSGVEYVTMPTDYSYLAVLIRAHNAGNAPFSVVSQVKMNVDANKFVPLDSRMTDLVRFSSIMHGPFTYRHVFDRADGDTIVFIDKYDEQVSLLPIEAADHVVKYQDSGVGQGVLTSYTAGSSESTDYRLLAICSGWCPFAVVPITYGQFGDPDQWFPAPSFGSVNLELTQAAASSTLSVCLVQARPY